MTDGKNTEKDKSPIRIAIDNLQIKILKLKEKLKERINVKEGDEEDLNDKDEQEINELKKKLLSYTKELGILELLESNVDSLEAIIKDYAPIAQIMLEQYGEIIGDGFANIIIGFKPLIQKVIDAFQYYMKMEVQNYVRLREELTWLGNGFSRDEANAIILAKIQADAIRVSPWQSFMQSLKSISKDISPKDIFSRLL